MLESWKLNVLFTVEHGEFVCIIGANGCGKTTTLKTVLGLMKPTADEIIRTDEKWSHISAVKTAVSTRCRTPRSHGATARRE